MSKKFQSTIGVLALIAFLIYWTVFRTRTEVTTVIDYSASTGMGA